MIPVSHLVKRYGSRVAVNDVSFEVGRGDVVGFLGPNGAGKSTTLRILAGFLGLTEGAVAIAGHERRDRFVQARKRVGYMPETAPLYPEMRVSEYLTFRAELKGVAGRARPWVGHAMEQARVLDVASDPSGPCRRGIASASGSPTRSSPKPPILILDEPTAGMDPNQIREVRAVVKELGASHTVLLSTHILSEVEATCSRVIVIAKGKLVAEGATRDVAKMRRTSASLVTVRGTLEAAKAALCDGPGWARPRGQDGDDGREGGDGQPVCSLRFRAKTNEASDGALLVEQDSPGARPGGARRARGEAGRRYARGPVHRAHLRRARGRRRRRRGGRPGPCAAPRRGWRRGVRAFWSIYKRELFAFFVTPLAWVLITVFLILQGMNFYWIIDTFATRVEPSDQTPLQAFFGNTVLLYLVLFLLVPPMTMRLFSEERRSGTIETLMTAPVAERRRRPRQVRRRRDDLPRHVGCRPCST